MKQRIVTGIAILAGLIVIVLLSGTPVYSAVLALLSAGAVFEMLRVLGQERDLAICIPAYLIALGLPFSAYFLRNLPNVLPAVTVMIFVLLLYMMYLFGVAVFALGKKEYRDLCSVYTLVSYITLAFTSVSMIRYLSNGVFNFLIVFISAWLSDVFAFFCGSFFGKHKLIPQISPKKTVEGSIGGVFFALIAMLLYGHTLEVFFSVEANYAVLAIIGILLPVLSQIGDLAASVIKRQNGVKDYGTILPGHGGIMDRFDSVIAVSAPTMIICLLWPPFV